jgi:hypothetical protein
MAFTLDRLGAANALEISTRTLDRYAKAGKLRSKKVGKKVFFHDADIEKIRIELSRIVEDSEGYSESIQNNDNTESYSTDADIVFFDNDPTSGFQRRPLLVDYRELFEDAQKRIDEKDRVIRELSFRVGQAESELKNSVSLLEHRKTAYLLEAAKTRSDEEKAASEKVIGDLKQAVDKEKTTTAILVIALSLLLVGFLTFWFFSF